MRPRAIRARALWGLVLVLALALALALSGCKKSDTVLLIELSGPQTNDFVPFQFRATITAGQSFETKAFLVPEVPSPSPLPQSFSVTLDRAHTGPITVSIVALDQAQQPLGSGTTRQEHIVIGGQTVIAVALTEDLPPDEPDGGATDGGDGGGADARDGAAGQDAGDAKADAGADKPGDGNGLDEAAD